MKSMLEMKEMAMKEKSQGNARKMQIEKDVERKIKQKLDGFLWIICLIHQFTNLIFSLIDS